ncbi:MAG: hypothetical protein ABSD74_01945 [Rhizomicrobium sp.]|jgi:hypothetical protein
MPKNIAQWTGITVTSIIVLGCDTNVFIAMPLGILAGALATFFVSLTETKSEPAPVAVSVKRLIRQRLD